MTLESWSLLALTCLLGALSPGPSLMRVLQISLQHGKKPGNVAALSHGVGVALWAAATVFGLSVLFLNSQFVRLPVSIAGACYLLFLGGGAIKSAFNGARAYAFNRATIAQGEEISLTKACLSGFSIAFLNPKLAIFFAALFSQFLSNSLTVNERCLMVILAGGIDAFWYLVVVLLANLRISQKHLLPKLRWIDFFAGVLFILIGINIIVYTWREASALI